MFLPIFSDWLEITKWKRKNLQTIILNITDCKFIVNDSDKYSGIILNPYGDNIAFSKEQVNNLFSEQQATKKETTVQIGEPAKYPTKMINNLKDYLSTLSSVSSAYLLYMIKDGEKSYLLIVDSDNPKKDFSEIGTLSSSYLDKNELLNIVPLNTQFGKEAVKDKMPFYTK